LILEVVVVVSVDGLLDTHEVSVRARVESLREQAARVAAELGEAELALEHVAITKVTLALVLAGPGVQAEAGQSVDTGAPVVKAERVPVPKWEVGLDERALPAGYRELWVILSKEPDGVRCKAAAVTLGLEAVPKKVEGVRSKLRRLARRGWAVEMTPGLFQAVALPAGIG
jgi:hypothetical protein